MSQRATRCAAALFCAALAAWAQSTLPASENLTYDVEWRLIRAGAARLAWSTVSGGYRSILNLESAGLVSRLYKVNNEYTSHLNDRLCVQNSLLKTNEGRKRTETTVAYEGGKARFVERDLVKNRVADSHEIDVPACEHDVVGALYVLRTMNVPLGQSVQIPVSDGKKAVMARVEAQARENIRAGRTDYKTVRYEAFLFNGVLYRREGRLFVWLTDDERKTPVQVRIRLPFYIGTVTLQLVQGGSTR